MMAGLAGCRASAVPKPDDGGSSSPAEKNGPPAGGPSSHCSSGKVQPADMPSPAIAALSFSFT
jgi:hypothetical protein